MAFVSDNFDNISIIKTNGSKEPWCPDKIHAHLTKACAGLNVDVISIIKDARLKIFDGAKSSDIQTALIKSAQEKISTDNPDYDLAAGRLLNQKIRKEVYGQFTPKDFADEVIARVKAGWYSKDLLKYSKSELSYFGHMLDYSADDQMSYSSLDRLYKSYLIKSNGKAVETPQEVFMLIPMAIFANEAPEYRSKYIELGYNLLRLRKISLPTPIMNGARTPFKRYVSCNLINFGDSVESLSSGNKAIMECTASKAGLGINASFIRGLGARIGDPVRVHHTGILPLIKSIEATTGSLTQVGRQGSCNISIPWFHFESDLFSQLGDSKGSLENRARHTDQTIILNRFFLEKALNKEDVYLFCMNEVVSEDISQDLYDALGDYDRFSSLYTKYSNTVLDQYKRKVNAFELLQLFITERMITGRVYFTFADNSRKGSFKENLYFTNLCCFTGDTLVKTVYGKDKPIKDIRVGDIVKAYDVKTNEVVNRSVICALCNGEKPIVEVKFNGNSVRCTSDHRFYTQRGYVEAHDLQPNDSLCYNGIMTQDTVEVVDLKTSAEVYDITVEDTHNFFANNMLVHNCEILVPSHSMDSFRGEHPEIGCCILGNINLGFAKDDDLQDCADFLVNFLDTMINESEYVNQETEYAALNRRTLGIGISNLFGYLAVSNQLYNLESTRKSLHATMEKFYYYLLDASCKLAQLKGPATLFSETKYADGVLAFDQYTAPIDYELHMPWEELRNRIHNYGLRNSSLCAVPPAASSSAVSGATSGIEPPRELITIKVDRYSTTRQLVPFYHEAKNWYTTAWGDDFNNKDYIKLVSVIQKFVDQSISLNLYYNLLNQENSKVDIQDILEELILSFNYGIKTWYYANFRTTDDQDGIKEVKCQGGCQV